MGKEDGGSCDRKIFEVDLKNFFKTDYIYTAKLDILIK